MKKLNIQFRFVQPEPESFESIRQELIDGSAACAIAIGEIFGGQSVLPAAPGYTPHDYRGFLDGDNWIECLDDLKRADQDTVLKQLPIYDYLRAFWEYVVDARWSKAISRQPLHTFHYVAAFCHLARFSVEQLSFNRVPINIERLYARARARMLVDIARDPRCDADAVCSDHLGLEDVALLAEIAPQSVRNALNARGAARLRSMRHKGEICIDPSDAHGWLLGRKRYEPTDLSPMEAYLASGKEVLL